MIMTLKESYQENQARGNIGQDSEPRVCVFHFVQAVGQFNTIYKDIFLNLPNTFSL